MSELSDKQVENWRTVLVSMIGPFAFYMSKEQVQRIRDNMQERLNQAYPEVSEAETEVKQENVRPRTEPFNTPRIVFSK